MTPREPIQHTYMKRSKEVKIQTLVYYIILMQIIFENMLTF